MRSLVRSTAPDRALGFARAIRDRATMAWCRGSNVSCPICGQQWRRFARFNGRRNARCPGCGALERHRLLWLYLTRETDLFTRPQRVLHIAPERFLLPTLTVTHGSDYVYGDIADPAHHLDVTELGFPDFSFDVIICSHVFEHVPNDRQALSEVFRVLAPGGWAILDAPVTDTLWITDEDPSVTTPQERRRRFGQWDHVRCYGRDYPDRLRGAGFRVEVDPVGTNDGDRARYGLSTARDHIYLCRRDPT